MKKLYLSGMFGGILLVYPSGVLAHGISAADHQRMTDGGNLDYIALGAEHMITGYDHLLFLLGVMFFLTRPGDIIKFVTTFTLGHTITLLGATYLGISANYYLIDAVIALTVIYKGFENLGGFRKWLDTDSPNLLYMVFAFGLIHGFGLSTRLQEIMGTNGDHILPRILSFNLGVELGQIAALVGMVAVLHLWRKRRHFDLFSKLVNGGLVAAGGLLLLFQLHSYIHVAQPDSFPTGPGEHFHRHDASPSVGHP